MGVLHVEEALMEHFHEAVRSLAPALQYRNFLRGVRQKTIFFVKFQKKILVKKSLAPELSKS